ncbi:MAG: hypothetical protein GJ680_06865 [Alteromonadaceae bacterium]|nr:hypothetical protein [Alteromonadaceae bacterium]
MKLRLASLLLILVILNPLALYADDGYEELESFSCAHEVNLVKDDFYGDFVIPENSTCSISLNNIIGISSFGQFKMEENATLKLFYVEEVEFPLFDISAPEAYFAPGSKIVAQGDTGQAGISLLMDFMVPDNSLLLPQINVSGGYGAESGDIFALLFVSEERWEQIESELDEPDILSSERLHNEHFDIRAYHGKKLETQGGTIEIFLVQKTY